MFLNGFLLASIFYFLVQARYEKGLFAAIKSDIETHIDADDTHDSVVVKAMHACHDLMINRAPVFGRNPMDLGPVGNIFHSTQVDLMTTKGNCGSYSEVLARIITTFHYPVRIAQMKAGDVWAAHNVVEAYTGTHWVLLDPTFDLVFTQPNHQYASFNDVHENWNYYAKQVPPGYDLKYRYEDVRYTNWSKFPVIAPVLKKLMTMLSGDEYADGISLRVLLIETWKIYFQLALLLESLLLLATIRISIRSRFPNRKVRITVKNLTKYFKLPTEASS
jgi:hypothetical protein